MEEKSIWRHKSGTASDNDILVHEHQCGRVCHCLTAVAYLSSSLWWTLWVNTSDTASVTFHSEISVLLWKFHDVRRRRASWSCNINIWYLHLVCNINNSVSVSVHGVITRVVRVQLVNADSAPGGSQPSNQADWLAVSLHVGCYHPHPTLPFTIITQSKKSFLGGKLSQCR